MTADLLDYFFNQRTQVFSKLDSPGKSLPHSIYGLATYRSFFPDVASDLADQYPLRQHQRYSVKCPGTLHVQASKKHGIYKREVVELSECGFQSLSPAPLPINTWGAARIQLDKLENSTARVMAVRDKANGFSSFNAFTTGEPNLPRRKFVNALQSGTTHEDFENATRFLPP